MTIATDELGRILIGETPSPAVLRGGRIFVSGRAEPEADLPAELLALGIQREVEQDDGSTVQVTLPHITLRIFDHWKVKPDIDEDGNVIDPGEKDPRPHFNMVIDTRWRDVDAILAAIEAWAANGTALAPEDQNRDEQGIAYRAITMLDPTTINSPDNIVAL